MDFLDSSPTVNPSVNPRDQPLAVKGFSLLNSPSQDSNGSLPSFNLDGNGDSSPERALSPSDPINIFLRSSPQQDATVLSQAHEDNGTCRKRSFLSFSNGVEDSNPEPLNVTADAAMPSQAEPEGARTPEPKGLSGFERSYCQTRRRHDADTWQPPSVDIPGPNESEGPCNPSSQELTAADFLDFFKSSDNSNAEKMLLSNLMSGDASNFTPDQPRGSRLSASQEASPALAISLLSSAALELGLAGGASLNLPLTKTEKPPTQQGGPSTSDNAPRGKGEYPKPSIGTPSAPPPPEKRPKKKPKLQDLVLFWLKGQKFFQDVQNSAQTRSAAQGSKESVGSQSKGSNSPPSPASPGDRDSPREQCGESLDACEAMKTENAKSWDGIDQLLTRVRNGGGLQREGSAVGPINLRAIEAWAKAKELREGHMDNPPLPPPLVVSKQQRVEAGRGSQFSGLTSPGSFGACIGKSTLGELVLEKAEEEEYGRDKVALKKSPLSMMHRADSLRSDHTPAISTEPSQASLDKAVSMGRGQSGEAGNRITPRSMVEKKRRERISVAFAGLKDVVNIQGDMAHVLQEAAHIIREQQRRLHEYQERELIQKLRDEVYNERKRH